MNLQRLFFLSILLILFFFQVCAQPNSTIYDVLRADSRFTTLNQQIELYKSVSDILSNSSGQYTIFAPVNSAFQPTLDILNIENRLKYYIVDGVYNFSQLSDGFLLPTKLYVPEIGGQLPVRITSNSSGFYVQWSELNINSTLNAVNGRIYPISLLYHIPPASSSVINDVTKFSGFKSLIEKAGLQSEFGASNTTIFVPSNTALNRTNSTNLNTLSTSQLSRLLRAHIVQGIYSASTFNWRSVVTNANSTITLKNANGTLSVDNSTVLYSNLVTKSGIIHVIDNVISVPQGPIENQNLRETLLSLNATAFVRALDNANLGDYLNNTSANITVFALPDSALEGVTLSPEDLQAALRYHLSTGSFYFSSLTGNNTSTVVDSFLNLASLAGAAQKLRVSRSGSGNLVNNVTVVQSDIVASNGVVHLINNVIPRPASLAEVLKNSGGFSRFIKLLTVAGFANVTARAETIFAPDDSAFEHLPELENLLISENPDQWQLDQLRMSILHHVLTSLVYDSYNINWGEFDTFNNDSIYLYKENGTLYVANTYGAGTAVIESNILAAEGVVHRIDHLLITKININKTLDVILSSMPSFSLFKDALASAGLLSILSLQGPFTVIAVANDSYSNGTTSDLQYHLLNGTVDLFGDAQNIGLLPSQLVLSTLGGYPQRLKLTKRYDGIFANDIVALEPGIEASNGYLFLSHSFVPRPQDIDSFLHSQDDFTPLALALDNYEATLSNGTISLRGALRLLNRVTVFAPQSVAFSQLSPYLIKYLNSTEGSADLGLILNNHIFVELSTSNSTVRYSDTFGSTNSSLTMRSLETLSVRRYRESNSSDLSFVVGSARVIDPDTPASNGVVHKIDRLLIPSTFRFTLEKALRTIDNAKLVVASIKGTGLSEILSSQDPHVLFVPTNNAFSAFIANRTTPGPNNKPDINSLLQLHIVDGSQTLEQGKGLKPRATGYVLVGGLNGKSVYLLNSSYYETVRQNNGSLTDYRAGAFVYANVVETVVADNGVAYVIDRVLALPSGSLPPPPPAIEGSGMSGLAILIIVMIIIVIIGAFGFYLYRKRKLQQTERLLD